MVAKPAMAPTHKPTRVGRPKRIHSILGGAGEKVGAMEASYKQKSDFCLKKTSSQNRSPKKWFLLESHPCLFCDPCFVCCCFVGAESVLFFCFGELWVINPSKTTRWNQLGCLFTGWPSISGRTERDALELAWSIVFLFFLKWCCSSSMWCIIQIDTCKYWLTKMNIP